MYLDFFKLKQLPFRLTADPRFHYKDAARADAAERLLTALSGPSADGCLLVTGDAGIGKTILIHAVLDQLPERFVVVQIRQPEISVAEFHAAIAAELGADAPAAGGAAAGANLDASLARQAAMGRCVVIALDNGELLAEQLLDEILRLPGRNGTAPGSLRVIIAARPRPDGRTTSPGLHIQLLPLTVDETAGYIEYRLRIAGRMAGGIFRADAVAEIQRFTGGVPRLINTLADAALMGAFNRSHDSITAVEVRGAANQLQWVEFDARADAAGAKANAADEPLAGHIRIEHDNAVIAEFDLPVGKISLGRAANNDVRIDSRYVSRNHCQIVTTAQHSVIEDLQSQNGLTVASRRVSVHRLQHGDRVKMGMHTLTYTRPRRFDSAKKYAFPLSLPSASGAPDTDQTGVILSGSSSHDAVEPTED
jgi:general secretion pathway protein A